MSEPKFTKGPWRVDEYGATVGANGKIIGVSGLSIGHFSATGTGTSQETEAKANAHVMRAAPELYRELDMQVRNCPGCQGTGESKLLKMLYSDKKAHPRDLKCVRCKGSRQALAKARGEA